MDIRRLSSDRVYHLDSVNSTPGKKGASTTPRMKRQATMPPKLCTCDVNAETRPQRIVKNARYHDGFPQ